jgi:hypothetical protein
VERLLAPGRRVGQTLTNAGRGFVTIRLEKPETFSHNLLLAAKMPVCTC